MGWWQGFGVTLDCGCLDSEGALDRVDDT